MPFLWTETDNDGVLVAVISWRGIDRPFVAPGLLFYGFTDPCAPIMHKGPCFLERKKAAQKGRLDLDLSKP
jgi:hypothetical protein